METIRATGEVSADGQTFTAEFTLEITGGPSPAGEYGPGHVTATRIPVEPMGTPVGSLNDLFSQLAGPSTPAGTEAVATAPPGTEPAGTEPAGTTAGTEPIGTEPMATTPMTEPATTPMHRTGRHHAVVDHDDLTAESAPVADFLPNR